MVEFTERQPVRQFIGPTVPEPVDVGGIQAEVPVEEPGLKPAEGAPMMAVRQYGPSKIWGPGRSGL